MSYCTSPVIPAAFHIYERRDQVIADERSVGCRDAWGERGLTTADERSLSCRDPTERPGYKRWEAAATPEKRDARLQQMRECLAAEMPEARLQQISTGQREMIHPHHSSWDNTQSKRKWGDCMLNALLWLVQKASLAFKFTPRPQSVFAFCLPKALAMAWIQNPWARSLCLL